MGLKAVFQTLGDMLFPPRCLFCDELIYPGWEICEACENEIAASPAIRRMKPGVSGETVWCLTPFRYEGQVKESLMRFKFRGHREYAPYYGRKLAEGLREQWREEAFTVATAVPLSKRRLRERGYNQAELIAREAAKWLGLPYVETLRKVKENQVQHELSGEERLRNVQGVYRACDGVRLAGEFILLIDDIVTTGATLCECARILLQEGAACVVCAAVADVHWDETQNSG